MDRRSFGSSDARSSSFALPSPKRSPRLHPEGRERAEGNEAFAFTSTQSNSRASFVSFSRRDRDSMSMSTSRRLGGEGVPSPRGAGGNRQLYSSGNRGGLHSPLSDARSSAVSGKSSAVDANERSNRNENGEGGRAQLRVHVSDGGEALEAEPLVIEEGTDVERLAEVALLMLKGSSESADDLLKELNAPDYVAAAIRMRKSSQRKVIRPEDLPSAKFKAPISHSHSQPLPPPIEQAFDLWFLQLASMEDHMGTALAGPHLSGAPNGNSGKAGSVVDRSPCIAEYVYRVQRLIKYHHYRKWAVDSNHRNKNNTHEHGGGPHRHVQSYVDDDSIIREYSLDWLLESFKERNSMLLAKGSAAVVDGDDGFDDEDPNGREQRIRTRRLAAQRAYAEEASERSRSNIGVVGSNAWRRHSGPPDAGSYFVLPGVGLGSVVGGTFTNDLEEPSTDYQTILYGEPEPLRKRIQNHLSNHNYGEQLLQHFTSTLGPEPPRERFGARCRRYVLGRHASLLPVCNKMLSEVFHNYLRLLAITFRLVLTGTDETVDYIGMDDIIKFSLHPPSCKVLETALAEEEAEAQDRRNKTAKLAEVSSANSFASLNRTQQAMRKRLEEQQIKRHQLESARELGGKGENGEGQGSSPLLVADETDKSPLENDMPPESEENIADAFSRIWCVARLLMGIFFSQKEGRDGGSSEPQKRRRQAHAQALISPHEHMTSFYRIAQLLKTNLNGSLVSSGNKKGEREYGSRNTNDDNSEPQLLFGNFLNIGALVAPVIEVAAERLLVVELSKRFGPEPVPPMPTTHTCEPIPTFERLTQFCRMDRFYRFHERSLDSEQRLMYPLKADIDSPPRRGAQMTAAAVYDTDYIGAKHTRKSLWRIFCRYLYYADDRHTTAPSRPTESAKARRGDDNVFADTVADDDAREEVDGILSQGEGAHWKHSSDKEPEFGSLEYFEKRFPEMSSREKAFFNEDNFRRLVARSRRRQIMGSTKASSIDSREGAAFSTFEGRAEQQREERNIIISSMPTKNVGSAFFGELKSLRHLWQNLLYKYGDEPRSETYASDQKKRAEEKATILEPERRKLGAFYRYYAPEKTAVDIDAALDRFFDNIPKMWELLEVKYGPLGVALARDGESSGDQLSIGTGAGLGGLVASGSPQLEHLAVLRDILVANGDPNKQLWYVDSLIKSVEKHVEKSLAAGLRRDEVTPLVNPYPPIVVTQNMIDVYTGTEAALIKQRHLLSIYFRDKGLMDTADNQHHTAIPTTAAASAPHYQRDTKAQGDRPHPLDALLMQSQLEGTALGGKVTEEGIRRLIEHYRYSPMGLEHMWAEVIARFGPDRDPIDPEKELTRAEMEYMERQRHTNDSEFVSKGGGRSAVSSQPHRQTENDNKDSAAGEMLPPPSDGGRQAQQINSHTATAINVVDTSDYAHWMLDREDFAQAERLENFFDYYTSGGNHHFFSTLEGTAAAPTTVAVKAGADSAGVAAASAVGRTLSLLTDSGTSNLVRVGDQTQGQMGEGQGNSASPPLCHRNHPTKSKEDLLALQRRFLKGSAGGYGHMWRLLEEKYGPQPPESFSRYNREIKRLKKEAARRVSASEGRQRRSKVSEDDYEANRRLSSLSYSNDISINNDADKRGRGASVISSHESEENFVSTGAFLNNRSNVMSSQSVVVRDVIATPNNRTSGAPSLAAAEPALSSPRSPALPSSLPPKVPKGGGVADDIELSPSLSPPRSRTGSPTEGTIATYPFPFPHEQQKQQDHHQPARVPPATPVNRYAKRVSIAESSGGGGTSVSSRGVSSAVVDLGSLFGDDDVTSDDRRASASAASAELVLGAERRRSALLAKTSHSDPAKALKDMQSSTISTPEEEQALVDMFLRWKGRGKQQQEEAPISGGQGVPPLSPRPTRPMPAAGGAVTVSSPAAASRYHRTLANELSANEVPRTRIVSRYHDYYSNFYLGKEGGGSAEPLGNVDSKVLGLLEHPALLGRQPREVSPNEGVGDRAPLSRSLYGGNFVRSGAKKRAEY